MSYVPMPHQVPPIEFGTWVLYTHGRGAGATTAQREVAFQWAVAGLRVAVVAPSWHRLDYLFKGPGWSRRGRIDLPGGGLLHGFTSYNAPDEMRGHYFDKVWLSDFSEWKPSLAREVVWQSWVTMSAASNPQLMLNITTDAVRPHVTWLFASNQPKLVLTGGEMRTAGRSGRTVSS